MDAARRARLAAAARTARRAARGHRRRLGAPPRLDVDGDQDAAQWASPWAAAPPVAAVRMAVQHRSATRPARVAPRTPPCMHCRPPTSRPLRRSQAFWSSNTAGQPRRRAAEAAEVPKRHGFEDVGAEEVARQSLQRWLFGLLRHGVQGKRTLGCASALITRRRRCGSVGFWI